MSFIGKIAEQAKVAAMAQIPAAIAASKGPIIDAIKTYIHKRPYQADVIKRNLAEISAGVQTAGTRKTRRTVKAGRRSRMRKTRARAGMKIPDTYKPYANIAEKKE
jgi:cell pole-organizing protein PopZ